MSFGRELKDFTASFQAGYKMAESPEDRDLKRARADYYKAAADKQGRDDESSAEADRRIAAARGGSTGSTGTVAPPEQVKAIIDQNVPENMRPYAYKMAKGESSFNPGLVNTDSGAAGLFQFVPDTGKRYGVVGKTALDPVANTKAFVKFTEDNKAQLTKLLGREPTWGELAVAHQQGVGTKNGNKGAYPLLMGRGVVVGKQAGNPKDAAGVAAHYGFDLNSKAGNTATTAPAKPAAIPTDGSTGWRVPKDLPSDPRKNMPDPNASPNKTAAIPGGFGGFGEFDTSPMEPQQYAAEGGAIEDPTAVSDEFAAKNGLTEQGRAELVGARKAAVSMAQQNNRPAELASNTGPAPMADYPLGSALDAGLKFIQNAFGMGQRPAVQGSDPNRQKNLAAYAAGAGSSEEDTDAAEKAVTGGKDVPRSQVVEKTVQAVGQKFKDNPEAAGRAVGTLLQTYRQRTMQAGQQALKQVQGGDMVGALNTLKTAYDNVPDGNTVVFEPVKGVDGETTGFVYKQLDKNSKVVGEGPVTMQALAEQAKLAAGGLAFDRLVMQAAKPSSPQGGPQGTSEAIPGASSAPPAPQDPRQPAPAAEAPAAEGVTPQVTAEGPAQTATDGSEPALDQQAQPAERQPAVSTVQRETPKPFAEPPPEMYDTSGMSPKTEGGSRLIRLNKEALDGWKARKAEWDRNERDRVNRQFEIEKAAANARDLEARQAATQREAAARADARTKAADARARQTAIDVATRTAEGRKDAEKIKIAGEERNREAKRADETEKADPNWQRKRRLAIEADPIGKHADEALQSGSMSMHSVGMNLKQQENRRRAAIAYESAPETKYADKPYEDRSGRISTAITEAMTEHVKKDGGKVEPKDVMRYTSLADQIAQRNNIDPAVLGTLVYGMITNRWSDGNQPRVQRDGTLLYGNERIVVPEQVLVSIIAENGHRTGVSDMKAMADRDKKLADQAEQERRTTRNTTRREAIIPNAVEAARKRREELERARPEIDAGRYGGRRF